MPNGGSDCCGTCQFNRKNQKQTGSAHTRDSGPAHCDIRNLDIETPYWTYCSNHPRHNPGRLRIPIGPVWTHGQGDSRDVWRPGPDTPEARAEILRLLAAATPEPIQEYPAGFTLVEAALIHAGELGDPRFIPHLDRIRLFPGFANDEEQMDFARDPGVAAALAAAALGRLLPPVEITPFGSETARAVAATVGESGDSGGLPVLADALQEAGCSHTAILAYLRSPDAAIPNWVVDVILGRVGG